MNYEPNTVKWQVGDLVIHDADGKIPEMLMQVVGYAPDGRCRTMYCEKNRVNGDEGRQVGRVWENDLAVLHDPARFGIAVPVVVERVALPVSVSALGMLADGLEAKHVKVLHFLGRSLMAGVAFWSAYSLPPPMPLHIIRRFHRRWGGSGRIGMPFREDIEAALRDKARRGKLRKKYQDDRAGIALVKREEVSASKS